MPRLEIRHVNFVECTPIEHVCKHNGAFKNVIEFYLQRHLIPALSNNLLGAICALLGHVRSVGNEALAAAIAAPKVRNFTIGTQR